MGRRIVWGSAALLMLGGILPADLIVRQMSNGRIVLSNSLDMVTGPKARQSLPLSRPTASIYDRYSRPVREAARRFGLREDLAVAVARAESSFNPFAISPKGAVGIMQLMHETAKQYGVNDRFNALQNIEAGIRHLRYLYDKYNADLSLTLAAYNAGEEAVAKYNGVPPYGETRTYIRRVLSFMGLSSPAFYASPARTRTPIYKYTTADGRVIITDCPPVRAGGTVEIIR